MRPSRSRTVPRAALALSSLSLVACFHSSLPSADRAIREGKYDDGMMQYQAVLNDGMSETWDKDRAEIGWKGGWKLRRAHEREKLLGDIAALETSQEPPAVILQKAQAILHQLKSRGNVQQEMDRVQKVVVAAAENDWPNVAALASRRRYIEAEDEAGRILMNPGLPNSFASRTAALRKEASSYFRVRETEANKYAAARAYFRGLAEHFEGRTLTQETALLASSKPNVALQLEAQKGCEGAAARIRQMGFRLAPSEPNAASPSSPGGVQASPGQALPGTLVTLRVSLSSCSATDTDRSENRTATYEETMQDGFETVTKYRESKQCYTSTFCNPGTTVGTGGTVYYTSNCTNTEICTPSVVPYTELVPRYVTKQLSMSYAHMTRNSAAKISGNATARLDATGEEAAAPLDRRKEEKDEQYTRVNRSGARDVRTFGPGSAVLLKKLEEELPAEVSKLVSSATKKRGDVVFTTAPNEPLARIDAAVRGTLYGSETAEKYLKTEVGFGAVGSLLSGTDPLPRNAESGPAPVSGSASLEDVPTPNRSSKSFEYESSFRMQVGLNFLSGSEAATNRSETAMLVGIRADTTGLSSGSHKGFQLIDTFTGFVGLGTRVSSEYKADQEAFGIAILLDYSLFLGFRTGLFGLFAGVRGQFGIGQSGDMNLITYAVPFCARGELRLYQNMIPTLTACAFSPVGSTYTSIEGFLPMFGRGESALHASVKYERYNPDPTFALELGNPVGPFSAFYLGVGFGR